MSSPPLGRKPPLPHRPPDPMRSRQVSDGGGSASSHYFSENHKDVIETQERAELGMVNSLDNRRHRVRTSSGDVWQSAVEGERPPLHSVPFDKVTHALERQTSKGSNASTNSGGSGGEGNRALRDIARRVMEKSRSGSSSVDSGDSASASSSKKHQRGPSRAHMFLDMIQEVQEEENDEDGGAEEAGEEDKKTEENGGIFNTVGGEAHPEQGHSLISAEGTDTDRLFAGAALVDSLFMSEIPEESYYFVSSTEDDGLKDSETLHGEMLPLRQENLESYGSGVGNKRLSRKKKKSRWQRLRERIIKMLDPRRLLGMLGTCLMNSYFLLGSIPIFFFSWVLFFYLNNPSFDFLPGNASLAWWVNFMGRLCLTLELSRLIQWVLIDNILLGTRSAARLLGPLVTLYAIQGRGWPFTLTCWSLVNLFILHGTQKFQRHWLLFLTFGVGNSTSDGYDNILASGDYLRLLVAMIFAGLVTSAKRTAVATYLGRRTFTEFKPRLERLLKEVVLISEVSELAVEIEKTVVEEDGGTVELDLPGDDRKVKFLGEMSWSSDPRLGRRRTNSALESDDESETSEVSGRGTKTKEEEESGTRPSFGAQNSSGHLPVKDLLDYWEEPVNKMDRSLNASIQDILKFRRALTFMDEQYPFGEAFGPATNRDQVLESAFKIYQNIVSSSETSMLSLDILYLLAESEDGVTVDRSKKRAMRKLFRPDAKHEVSMMSFIRACDSLYRRMRFFRASVGNASVIDHALETILDGFFNFLLGLVLLSILQINPWPLLVSISTLLVSISFAVGPSAAKYIEGLLLVAVRRPYDLGDRIYMHDPAVLISDGGLDYSWFVEDINLFNTTIRYAGTNEVATLSNGSIAHMRIVNGNRSPNAMVWFQMPYNHSILEEEKFSSFKAFLEAYAKLHPNKWHSMSYVRKDLYTPAKELVTITIGFQSRFSWQDLMGVYYAKSDLIAAVIEYGRKEGINYEELPQRQFHYQAGVLKQGAVWKHRGQLHLATNIRAQGDSNATTAATGPNATRAMEEDNDEGGDNQRAGPLLRTEMNLGEAAPPPFDNHSPNSLFLSHLRESH